MEPVIDQQPPTTQHAPTIALWPLADQRHLYMIVAGIVLGVVLGPAVLGKVVPNLYDRAFVGSGDTTELDAAVDARDAFYNDADTRNATRQRIIDQHRLIMDDGDSAEVAMEEQLVALSNRFADEEEALKLGVVIAEQPVNGRRDAHAQRLAGLATTLLLALCIAFAVESIMGPPTGERGRAVELPAALARLVTVRYALIAIWVALMLAQPAPLKQVANHLPFAALLVAVIIVAGFVPLGKRASGTM